MEGPRSLRLDEAPEVISLISQIFKLDKHYSHEFMLSAFRRPSALRNTLVIAERGKPVSQMRVTYDTVSIYGCPVKVASIGTVLTAESCRNKGYAGIILKEAIAQMERAGVKILIVSGDRTLYRRNHCVPAGKLFAVDIRKSPRIVKSSLSVRRVTPDDWPLLAPLHRAENIRFRRTIDFLSRVPFWWDCERPELWLVESSHTPLAYLALTPSYHQPHSSIRVTFEYAGSRPHLVDALPMVMKAGEIEQLNLNVLGHDIEFLQLLKDRGYSFKERSLSGTHRIIDLPGMMQKLRPFLSEILPRSEVTALHFEQEADLCAISYRGERLELSLSETIRLVLNGIESTEMPASMKAVLARVFPIPFPMPGFNYI